MYIYIDVYTYMQYIYIHMYIYMHTQRRKNHDFNVSLIETDKEYWRTGKYKSYLKEVN
jgi:hypothetical protein